MKYDSTFAKCFFAMMLFIIQPSFGRERLLFTAAPDTLVFGREYTFTCSLSGTSPTNDRIKSWDWCIVSWNYDRIDTLAAYHSDQAADTCTWSPILTHFDGAVSKTSAPSGTYIVVRAVDANSNVLCAAKDVSIAGNSLCLGCLQDVMYTYRPADIIYNHQTLASRSIFYDDDYSGSFIDYWSWRVVLLSTGGYETIAASDSVYSHDSCAFSITIDSLDMTKEWITSESGAIFGFINIYAISSDSIRYNNVFIFKYSNQPADVRRSDALPLLFRLDQNYPNPFNPKTVISYRLPVSSFVILKVYNLIGREVATLVNERKSAGDYAVQWDASHLPSGIYFYRLQARPTLGGQSGTFSEARKIVLIK